MADIQTEFLFEMQIEVEPPIDAGVTPYGHRRIAVMSGGHFEGPKMRGKVLPGGGDWLLFRPDGVVQLDVRAHLRTDDGAILCISYRGHRHGPQAVLDRLNAGQPVDPSEYYFRATPYFETSAEKYLWMNRMCFVATAHRLPVGPVFRIFTVL